MSGIVLSASVRQNLLSLQSTADLLVHHPEPSGHWQQGQFGSRQSHQLLHRAGPQQPRQRHQQPARQHRQRRAGPAGRQHRHHLAAEAGRYREVDRQPGAAGSHRLLRPSRRLLRQQRIGRHRGQPGRRRRYQSRPDYHRRRERRGLPAVTVTFGATESLDQLNTALAAGNLTASLDSSNKLVFTTTNDYGFVHDRCGYRRPTPGGTATVRRPQSRRLPMPPRRPFVPAW